LETFEARLSRFLFNSPDEISDAMAPLLVQALRDVVQYNEQHSP
jgi:hypothetical protein